MCYNTVVVLPVRRDFLLLFILMFRRPCWPVDEPAPKTTAATSFFERCSSMLEEIGKQFEAPQWLTLTHVPRPSGASRFDPESFENWVAAQPQQLKIVFDFVRTHLRRVSKQEFEA